MPELTGAQVVAMAVCLLFTIFAIVAVICEALQNAAIARYKAQNSELQRSVDETFDSNSKALWGDGDEEVRRG